MWEFGSKYLEPACEGDWMGDCVGIFCKNGYIFYYINFTFHGSAIRACTSRVLGELLLGCDTC